MPILRRNIGLLQTADAPVDPIVSLDVDALRPPVTATPHCKPDETAPVRIAEQRFHVTYADHQLFRPRRGHVEPLRVEDESPVPLSVLRHETVRRPHSRDDDDAVLGSLEVRLPADIDVPEAECSER